MRRRARAAVLATLAAGALACSGPVNREASWPVFGEEASVELWMATEEDVELALRDARTAMETVEATMSFERPDSELARLNQAAAGGFYAVRDPDLYRCLLLGLDYARASRGAFDPTVGGALRLWRARGDESGPPSPEEIEQVLAGVGWQEVTVAPEARAVRFRKPGTEIDLGGVAKGYALDAAARVLARPGSRGALLRIGRNLYAWNPPPGSSSWSIDLPDPRASGRSLGRIEIANRGLAVSGNPEVEGDEPIAGAVRVLDPRTGRPAGAELLAAAGVATSAADADALATALFASSFTQATDLLERMRDVEALLLLRGEEGPYLLASGTLRGRFEPSAELLAEVDGDIRWLLPPTE